MVRKEPKGHGTNQYIEGPVKPGDSAVIVEDAYQRRGIGTRLVDHLLDLAERLGLRLAG